MKQFIGLMVVLSLVAIGCGKRTEYIVGQKGDQGNVGPTGAPGADGSSCTVSSVVPNASYPNGGAVITCGTSTVVVENGATGASGADAVAAILKPCPSTHMAHSEVLLKLSSGEVVASMSANQNGDQTRLSILATPGSYVTTDGRGCSFSLDANGDLI